MISVNMNKKLFKIGIIGAGSIGSLFGGYLANLANLKPKFYKVEVILFGRRAHIGAINREGLSISKDSEIIEIKNIKGYTNPREYQEEDNEKFKYLFLTTKTYDIKEALSEYENLIKDAEWLVILQNGIGNEALVKKRVPERKIIRIITSNGALLYSPGKVKHMGYGFTKVGFPFIKTRKKSTLSKEYWQNLNLLKKLLTNSGIETDISEDIIRDCWEKVFVNIGINPFGALTRLKNGELLKNKNIKSLMGEAVEEAVKIAKLKNIKLSERSYKALTYDVAKKTAENKNSMLQDILKGKKTEINFMNGRIVKYAEELGVQVPINRTLYYLIKGLEKS